MVDIESLNLASPDEDRELASHIRRAARDLMSAMDAAADRGLAVRLHTQEGCVIGCPVTRTSIDVEIVRPL